MATTAALVNMTTTALLNLTETTTAAAFTNNTIEMTGNFSDSSNSTLSEGTFNQISPIVSGDNGGDGSVSATSNVLFEEALTNFSFSMYEALDKTSNEFLSPFSISAALMLLAIGTDGSTKSQIVNSMFDNDEPDDIKMGYKILSDKLASRTDQNNTLSAANRLFPSDRFKLLKSYNDDALEYFGAQAELQDYVKDAEGARVRINDWIALQTNNKIQNMLQQGSLNPATVNVLVNAIYFKGKWKTPFDPKETLKRNFFVSANEQKQVDMMSGKFNALSGEDLGLDCKILKLPYIGDDLSMVILLPNDGNGLGTLETKLNVGTLKQLISNAKDQEAIIKIPKFIMEAEYNLRPVFEAMGISEIFDEKTANFTNMVTDDSPNVYVSDARHKAFIEVTEEGTEAAASTAIIMETRSSLVETLPPFEFIADHPFIFFIQDDDTETVLFIGRFVDP